MAIKIFSTSHLSSLPSQAVSLIRLNIFKRLSRDSFEYWTTMDEGIEAGGSIFKIPILSKNRLFRYFGRLRWLWKTKPDVILFSGEFLDILFYFLRPRKSKLVMHLNGPVPYPLRDYPYRNVRFDILWRSVVFFLRRVDYVLTISRYAADSLKPFKLTAKVEVIYNGVDLEQFQPDKRDKTYLKKKFGLDDSKKIFSFIGALILRKRPQLFIELAKRFSEIQFVLVGGDNSELDLSKEISQTKNIFWIKQMSRKDIVALLACSDLFIFPSLFEGFGMVVAEAMVSGCPVIASSGSGPEELVSKDCGIIVPRKQSEQEEIEEFSLVIKNLLSNPEKLKKMGLAGRQRALNKFDWNVLAEQWRRVLKSYV